MRRGPRWAWLLPMLLAVCPAGCTKPALRKKGPEDPLFATKHPARSRFADVTADAGGEPTPPASPAGAWVAVPPSQPASSVRLGIPQPNAPHGTAPATLAWSTDKPQVSLSPTAQLQAGVANPYARAADCRWLQGVLERTPGDQWVLRFEALSRDSQGGKVLLEGHSRLDLLQAGDVIRVEGQFVEEKETTAQAAWLPHPRYLVRGVRLIQPVKRRPDPRPKPRPRACPPGVGRL